MKSLYLFLIICIFINTNCTNQSNNEKQQINSEKISLLASNNNFVCAPDDSTNKKLIANREKIGDWETFQINYIDKNTVSILSFHSLYVSADLNKEGILYANRNEVHEWETFNIEQLGNNQIALKASNGKYVCADYKLGGILIANRDNIGDWEKFTIVKNP